jgi:multicomponent Na+:H+ antiporter subunit C
VSVLLAFVAAGLFGCGLYMVLSRHLVRMVLGLSLLTTAVNLMVFQAGRIRSAQPPLIAPGAERLGESADPVPQALVLTAIVIGFALTLILTALVLRAWEGHRSAPGHDR